MLCTKCGKYNATTHYKSVVNGKVYEEYLCPNCAENLNISSFYFPNVFSSLLGENANIIKITRCSCCGSSFNDIKRSGKADCSKCYETFKEEILHSLNQIHCTTKHKLTEGVTLNKSVESKTENALEIKKQELKQAVLEERFEDAAKLRDEIKNIEGAN